MPQKPPISSSGDMTPPLIVTGAAGFIGSHLSAALVARGHQVTGIDNFDPFYPRQAKLDNIDQIRVASRDRAGSFDLIEDDIRHAQKMRDIFSRLRPQCVFHIAALAGVRPSIADPARYASVNLDGLVSVLEAARASGCRNVVFASSSSVYGNNKKVPFSETDSVDDPISPYAATKRAGELICHTYAHLFGMRIAALRFFTVYGPRQRPDLAIMKFMRMIAAGEDVPMFGDGTTSRDYTYIDDIVDGVLAAERVLASPSAPGSAGGPAAGGACRIWNLGGSHPYTLSEMIDTIAKAVGKPARIKRLPMQPGDVERTWADLARSKAELGFEPHTSFEYGVE